MPMDLIIEEALLEASRMQRAAWAEIDKRKEPKK